MRCSEGGREELHEGAAILWAGSAAILWAVRQGRDGGAELGAGSGTAAEGPDPG